MHVGNLILVHGMLLHVSFELVVEQIMDGINALRTQWSDKWLWDDFLKNAWKVDCVSDL